MSCGVYEGIQHDGRETPGEGKISVGTHIMWPGLSTKAVLLQRPLASCDAIVIASAFKPEIAILCVRWSQAVCATF